MRYEYVLTEKCNLKCVYCSFGEYVVEKSFKQVKNDFLRIRKNDIDEISITGGEPSLRKDLAQIIRYAKKIGFNHVHLETNGYGLEDIRYAKLLISSGLDSISLSFQAVNSRAHDRVVGVEGNHKKLLRAIEVLKKMNFSKVLLTPVLTEFNYREIPEMIEFADKHKYFLLFNFSRIHQHDFFEKSKLKYKDVVPLYSKVCKIFYDFFKANPSVEAYDSYNNIPPCAFNAIGKDVFKYIKPIERRLSLNDLSEESKLYSKPAMCKKCKFFKTCYGIFLTYEAERGLSGLKPVLK